MCVVLSLRKETQLKEFLEFTKHPGSQELAESVDDRIPAESGNDSQYELAGSTTSLMQCTVIRP